MDPFDIIQRLPALALFFLIVTRTFIWVWDQVSQHRRTQDMALLAPQMNLGYLHELDFRRFRAELPPLPLLTQGHSPRIRNVMRGTAEGVALTLFDYSFTIGSGKRASDYSQTVILMNKPNLDLPVFLVAPTRYIHGWHLAYDRVTANEHYVVWRGAQEPFPKSFASQLLCTLEAEPHKELYIEGAGTSLLIYGPRLIPPSKLSEFIDSALGTLHLITGASREAFKPTLF